MQHHIRGPYNCDYGCQMLFTILTAICDGFYCQTAGKFLYAFSGNSKQLQWHDSVHLSSVYTVYSFSSYICAKYCTNLKRMATYVRVWDKDI